MHVSLFHGVKTSNLDRYIRMKRIRCGAICWGTNRKVKSLIPDAVIVIFQWHNPSGRSNALWWPQRLRIGPCLGPTTLRHSCAGCLEIWGRQGLTRPVHGLLCVLHLCNNFSASLVFFSFSKTVCRNRTNSTLLVSLLCAPNQRRLAVVAQWLPQFIERC